MRCPACGEELRLAPDAELVRDTEAERRRRAWQAAEDEALVREAHPAGSDLPRPVPSYWPEDGPR